MSLRLPNSDTDKTLHKYWTSACSKCPIKSKCTRGGYRCSMRREHESILDRVQEGLDGAPEAMRVRRQAVEHVFGTLKAWMEAAHCLTETRPRVQTEMSLQFLACSVKRAMKMLRTQPLIPAMKL